MKLKNLFLDTWKKKIFNLNWIYPHKILVTMYSIPYTRFWIVSIVLYWTKRFGSICEIHYLKVVFGLFQSISDLIWIYIRTTMGSFNLINDCFFSENKQIAQNKIFVTNLLGPIFLSKTESTIWSWALSKTI